VKWIIAVITAILGSVIALVIEYRTPFFQNSTAEKIERQPSLRQVFPNPLPPDGEREREQLAWERERAAAERERLVWERDRLARERERTAWERERQKRAAGERERERTVWEWERQKREKAEEERRQAEEERQAKQREREQQRPAVVAKDSAHGSFRIRYRCLWQQTQTVDQYTARRMASNLNLLGVPWQGSDDLGYSVVQYGPLLQWRDHIVVGRGRAQAWVDEMRSAGFQVLVDED
jgi:hypothetical protein